VPKLDKTRALIAGLASAIGLPSLSSGDDGGYQLTVGEDTDVLIYGGDNETILVVAPIADLPLQPDYGLTVYLLGNNMFDSPLLPFHVAIDDGGGLILWSRLPIERLNGESLASVMNGLAQQVKMMREELQGEAVASA